jgi:hypothetical protein
MNPTYWLTAIRDADLLDGPLLHELIKKANELAALVAQQIKRAKSKY